MNSSEKPLQCKGHNAAATQLKQPSKSFSCVAAAALQSWRHAIASRKRGKERGERYAIASKIRNCIEEKGEAGKGNAFTFALAYTFAASALHSRLQLDTQLHMQLDTQLHMQTRGYVAT